MKISQEGGFSFFKFILMLTVVVLVLCIGIPSVKTLAGQTGIRACESNIETITKLENEYYRIMGVHTYEYLNLDIVDEDSTLFAAGFLSEDDIICRQTGGRYQWQNANGEIILVCTGHQNID